MLPAVDGNPGIEGFSCSFYSSMAPSLSRRKNPDPLRGYRPNLEARESPEGGISFVFGTKGSRCLLRPQGHCTACPDRHQPPDQSPCVIYPALYSTGGPYRTGVWGHSVASLGIFTHTAFPLNSAKSRMTKVRTTFLGFFFPERLSLFQTPGLNWDCVAPPIELFPDRQVPLN